MMFYSRLEHLALLVTVAFLGGCGQRQGGAGARHQTPYAFNIMNRSGGLPAPQCELHWGPHVISFGDFSGNGSKGFSSVDYPLPEKARLSWTTEDGVTHEAEADVPRIAGQRVTYCLVILPDESLKVGAFLTQEYLARQQDLELARNGGPAYVVGTKNDTGAPVKELVVRFGPFVVNGARRVDPGGPNRGWAFAHGLPYPVTDAAEVHWTTEDGTEHKKDLDLKPELPPDLNGVCIAFIIGEGERVDVKMLPWADWETWRQ